RRLHDPQRVRGGVRARPRGPLPQPALPGGARRPRPRRRVAGDRRGRFRACAIMTVRSVCARANCRRRPSRVGAGWKEGSGSRMNPFYKNLALWMVIGLVVVLLFNVFSNLSERGGLEPSYSDFIKNVEAGRVESVTIRGNLVTGRLKDGAEFRTHIVDSPDLVKLMRDKGVRISVKPPDQNPWYMSLLLSWFPMILFIGVWIFFMRQMQGGGAKALSFGKARARLISEKHNKVTFADVAGVDEAKEELREIIEFLKDPQKFQKLGGKIPKGVLLV